MDRDRLFYQDFVTQNAKLHDLLLSFIQCENDNHEKYQKLIKHFELSEISKNKSELRELLWLISKMSNDCHRNPSFFTNIEQVLLFFKDYIKNTFTNSELYHIFKHNKRVLLYLIQQEIIILKLDDEEIIINLEKDEYFQPELEPFMSNNTSSKIKAIENYSQKRQLGENDSNLCELIRSDSIELFQSLISQTNISIESTINQSIFETNNFLLKHQATLIEYSAFFGSIKIFKFLLMNDAILNPILWLYAIHGSDFEIIHLLESNNVEPENNNYQIVFKEAIKCHNSQVALYIKENYVFDDECSYGFHYHNYEFFHEEFNYDLFIYFCKYDYYKIVDFILKGKEVDYNKETISNSIVNEILSNF